MSQNNNVSGEGLVWAIAQTFLLWLWLVLAGAWVISKWLTRLLYEYVLFRFIGEALARHDGLVIVLSGGLWTVIFGWGYWLWLYPQIVTQHPDQALQTTLIFLALGLAWGVSIGFWLLLEWWSEIANQLEPVYEPVQLLNRPRQISSEPDEATADLPDSDELAADLEEIFVEQSRTNHREKEQV